jgi:hypothetical protein
MLKRGVSEVPARLQLYEVALLQGDAATMKQLEDEASGQPWEFMVLFFQTRVAGSSGRLKDATQNSLQSAEGAGRLKLTESAAGARLAVAQMEAAAGYHREARASADAALAISNSRDVQLEACLVFAAANDNARAEALMKKLLLEAPMDFRIRMTAGPIVEALLALNRGESGLALEKLRPVAPYERAVPAAIYLRGLAYLQMRDPANGSAEFQKLIKNRGMLGISILYPLAHVGLARAATIQGNVAEARAAYQDFFALWKDADPDIPVLLQARQEYAKLNPQ